MKISMENSYVNIGAYRVRHNIQNICNRALDLKFWQTFRDFLLAFTFASNFHEKLVSLSCSWTDAIINNQAVKQRYRLLYELLLIPC